MNLTLGTLAIALGMLIAGTQVSAAHLVFRNDEAIETRSFDFALAALMRADEPVIRVDIRPDALGTIPPHLNGWLAQVLSEDNQVRWRDVGNRRSAVSGEAAGVLVARILTELVDVPAAESTAAKYHAVLELQSDGASLIRATAVVFYRHGTTAWGHGLESSHGLPWGNDW